MGAADHCDSRHKHICLELYAARSSACDNTIVSKHPK